MWIVPSDTALCSHFSAFCEQVQHLRLGLAYEGTALWAASDSKCIACVQHVRLQGQQYLQAANALHNIVNTINYSLPKPECIYKPQCRKPKTLPGCTVIFRSSVLSVGGSCMPQRQ